MLKKVIFRYGDLCAITLSLLITSGRLHENILWIFRNKGIAKIITNGNDAARNSLTLLIGVLQTAFVAYSSAIKNIEPTEILNKKVNVMIIL